MKDEEKKKYKVAVRMVEDGALEDYDDIEFDSTDFSLSDIRKVVDGTEIKCVHAWEVCTIRSLGLLCTPNDKMILCFVFACVMKIRCMIGKSWLQKMLLYVQFAIIVGNLAETRIRNWKCTSPTQSYAND